MKAKDRKEYIREWRAENKELYTRYQYKSRCKAFINRMATREELTELKKILGERLEAMKKEDCDEDS